MTIFSLFAETTEKASVTKQQMGNCLCRGPISIPTPTYSPIPASLPSSSSPLPFPNFIYENPHLSPDHADEAQAVNTYPFQYYVTSEQHRHDHLDQNVVDQNPNINDNNNNNNNNEVGEIIELSKVDILKKDIAFYKQEIIRYKAVQEECLRIITYPLKCGGTEYKKPKQLKISFGTPKQRRRHEQNIIKDARKRYQRIEHQHINDTIFSLQYTETKLKLILGREYFDKHLQVHLIPDLANMVQEYIDIDELVTLDPDFMEITPWWETM